MRGLSHAAVLFLLAGAVVPAVQAEPASLEGRPLVAAASNNFPPVNKLDDTGQLIGFGRDISSAVVAALGGRLEYVHSSYWSEVVDLLLSGRADFIHDVGYMSDREDLFDFTTSILEMREAIFVRAGERGPRDVTELAGRSIACVEDHITHLYLSRLPGVDCHLVRTPVEGLYALTSGAVDAFPFPDLIMVYLSQQVRLNDRIEVSGYLRDLWWGMAVTKGDRELLALLNQGIASIKASGEYQRIHDKWFGWRLLAGYTREQLYLLAAVTGLAFLSLGVVVGLIVYGRRSRERDQRLRAIMQTTADALVTTDAHGTIRGVNPAMERMFGYQASELLGENVRILLRDRVDPSVFLARYRDAGGQAVGMEALRKDGTPVPVEVTVTETDTGGTRLFTAFLRDVSERSQLIEALESAVREAREANEELRRKNAELSYFSWHDTLTGLANRRRLDDFLAREWSRLSRAEHAMSVILIDIDNFKRYNDLFGHQQGDQALRQVAEILKSQLKRGADIVARYGGEEFCVVLPETSLDGAVQLAEAMRAAVQGAVISHPGSATGVLTISAGVACQQPVPDTRPESVISRADAALYQAKAAGRNQVRAEDAACPS